MKKGPQIKFSHQKFSISIYEQESERQTSAGKHMRLSQILELPDNGLPKIAQKRQK